MKILSHKNAVYTDHRCHDTGANKVFGFWIYLMSDCILFATLFATYAVLSSNAGSGPTSKDIFELPFILIETFFLLFSSITYGMVMPAVHYGKKVQVNILLILTFIFGLSFICMEFYEFYHLIIRNYTFDHSAFLSSFFTLVGTHGLHIVSGLLWILVMIIHISYRGLTKENQIRLQCLSLFWHFLDIIWICIFTVVYLMGVI